MGYFKVIGFLGVSVILLALLGSGSAMGTVLCTNATEPCSVPYPAGTELRSELVGSSVFETSSEVLDTCTSSTTSGQLANGGSLGTVSLSPGMTFSFCGVVTVVVKAGSLEIHKISGSWNATLTGQGAEITMAIFGVTCTYGTGSGTDLGTFTAGLLPRFDISTSLFKTAGGFLCPSTVGWTAAYEVTVPHAVYIAGF